MVNGSLNAADVSSLTGVDTLNYGSVPANDCLTQTIDTNVNVDGDVYAVTVDDTINFANGGLTVHASDSTVEDLIRVNACNVTAAAIDPPAATFAYVVFQR